MKNLSQILLAITLLTASNLTLAVNYILPVPLTETREGNTRVSNVSTGQLELPIISWGADIATLHANGNAVITKNNSLFSNSGLDFKIVREDIFSRQLEKYLSGKTPYLRGTMGMINMASDVLEKDSRTRPIVIAKLSDSSGGDALVVKNNIKNVADLKGKTIVLQAYGPHLDYLSRILKDAGLSLNEVTIKWVKDLTGTDNSPAEALHENNVDAVFVITPDALALTSNGNVGTGSEGSVRGARILMSTKTANTVITDVYAVRSDYLESNREAVNNFVLALIKAQEEINTLISKNTNSNAYQNLMKFSAKVLLDSENAIADVQDMYNDAELSLFNGNKTFFTDNKAVRRFEVISNESLQGIKNFGLATGNHSLTSQKWNYNLMQQSIGNVKQSVTTKFDQQATTAVVNRMQQQGTLADGELYSFEVYFAPNQNTFSADLYQDAFNKVIELASTYGGALITVEGHSDPMQYLKAQKSNETALVLGQIKQSAKNLSFSRAQNVRNSILSYGKSQSILLDPSQFVVAGQGISMPKTGICGNNLCAPKNEAQWRSNMRVVFRIIQVEAESSVFSPL